MTRIGLAAITLVPLVILQGTFVGKWRIGDGACDLVFVAVILVAMVYGVADGLIWGLVAGIIVDVLSAAPFGATPVALAIAVLTVSWVINSTMTNSTLAPVIGVALGAAVYYLATAIALSFTLGPIPWFTLLSRTLLSAVIIHGLLVVPLYWLLWAWRERSGPIRVGR